ncbi:MAG: gene transfer agent family protein [bacterium]
MTKTERGDVSLDIDGQTLNLRLTLGALAEIEEALRVDDLTSLVQRLSNPSTNDILVIVSILARAGGTPLPLDLLRNKKINLKQVLSAITASFKTALGGEEAAGKPDSNIRNGKTGVEPGLA